MAEEKEPTERSEEEQARFARFTWGPDDLVITPPVGDVPADVIIRNEEELLTAMGLEDRSHMADLLWAYVDGVVYFHDTGIVLQPGFQTEGLDYPFFLQDLHDLAQTLEESEVLLQAAERPPSPARLAKDAHAAFGPEADRLATEVLGDGYRAFSPRPMTTFAFWYEDSAARKLMAVVAPTELPTVTDEVLAYALAWQHDRELILILSDEHAGEVTRRLPWIGAPTITVLTLGGELRTQDRAAVLSAASAFKARTVHPFQLDIARSAWVEGLLSHPVLQPLEAHARASYLSWHHRGLQVLRLASTRGGLRVQAGVQYSKAQTGHLLFNKVITGPLSDEELALATDAVAGSIAAGGSLTTRQTEHRLQADLGSSPPPALGLPHLAREYPGYRGPGRPGYIDFLGCDAEGDLHVVETKVGHDPKIVLQALDYGIWVQANEQAIRASRPDWPLPPADQTQMHLDFVLAARDDATAIGPYLAGQLEVLASDIHWRIFVIPNLDETPLAPTEVPGADLWSPRQGVTSKPVRPRRTSTTDAAPPRSGLPLDSAATRLTRHLTQASGAESSWDAPAGAARLLGEPGPWGRHLPTAWRAAASGDLAPELPADPTDAFVSAVTNENHAALLAWWTPLLHLTMFGLGWTRPDLGLQRWSEQGRPTEDPILALVDRWWGRRIDDFLAWTGQHPTVADFSENVAPQMGAVRHDVRASPQPDVAARRRDEQDWAIVWGGGTDPLHLLGPHATTPLELSPAIGSSVTVMRTQGPDEHPEAAVLVDSYVGWYAALTGHGLAVNGTGREKTDVVCRPIGWLGTYRRSTMTGVWFRGRHRWHELGN